jgi:hypothetical protein
MTIYDELLENQNENSSFIRRIKYNRRKHRNGPSEPMRRAGFFEYYAILKSEVLTRAPHHNSYP